MPFENAFERSLTPYMLLSNGTFPSNDKTKQTGQRKAQPGYDRTADAPPSPAARPASPGMASRPPVAREDDFAAETETTL